MQFTLRTLFLFFVVFWTSLAAFGVLGIVVTVSCLLLAKVFVDAKVKCYTPIILAVLVFVSMVTGDFVWGYYVSETNNRIRSICWHSNLKRIGMALHEYHDTYGCFPPVCVTDGKGQSLHSWRTLILPDLREQNLYDKYDFTEPWNGANNKKLPRFETRRFRCPMDRLGDETTTSYVAVTGPGTAWQKNRGVSLQNITDGPSKTALIVELLDSNIHWMEPRDITLRQALGGPNGKASVPSSGHAWSGGYFFRGLTMAGNMLMADGTVESLLVQPSSTDMAALLSINGNDDVDIQKLQAVCPPDSLFRWDHIIGLPLFLITVTWFWIRLLPKKGINGDCAKKLGGGGRLT